MSTPKQDVLEIMRLLEDNYEKYNNIIRIELDNNNYNSTDDFETRINSWKLIPNNIYLLAKKVV